MTTIKDIQLDLSRSSNNDFNWELVFTSGSFLSPGTSRQVGSAAIRINKKDYTQCKEFNVCLYNIYYNPMHDSYSIIDQHELDECAAYGYLIGGFQIKNCKMFFVSPNSCEGINYVRNFTPDYNNAFSLTEFVCEDGVCQGDFNNTAFNNAYDTKCIIGETEGSSFGRYAFDNSYDNDTTKASLSHSTPSRAFTSGFNLGFGA